MKKTTEFHIRTLVDMMKSLGVHSESEVFDTCKNKGEKYKKCFFFSSSTPLKTEIYFHDLALLLRGNKFPKVNPYVNPCKVWSCCSV